MSLLRSLLCLLGIILFLPLIAVIILAFRLPVSTSGIFYLIASFLVIAGLIAAPFFSRYYIPIVLGLVILLGVAGIRWALLNQNSSAAIEMITLPQGTGIRFINTLIDEQDALLFGEELFHRIGGDSQNEHQGLVPAFITVYSQMKKQGNFPSPVVSTYLNLQQPDRFDATIIRPGTQEKPKFAVVFLHGYMGNVSAQCWVIAQAVKQQGGMTVCPSTDWTGQWWQPEGQRILHSTFHYVHNQGIEKIILGGFSNGGFSIGHLTPQFAGEQDLRGLIFIDGFINGSEIKRLDLPVLILEGSQDERVPVNVARQFAEQVGDLGTYVELDSDHFLIIKKADLVQNEIAKWLGRFIAED